MTASTARTVPMREGSAQLHRAMGLRDLLLFYLVTGFTVRWIGTAASAGPSAIVEPHQLAVTKVAGLTILLVAGGALVYFLGTRRAHDRR